MIELAGNAHDGEDLDRPDVSRARAAYTRAEMRLRAVLEDYTRARVTLEEELARCGQSPLPVRLVHYYCGHPGMDLVERGTGSLLALCPVCRRLQAAYALTFTPAFTVSLPQRDRC